MYISIYICIGVNVWLCQKIGHMAISIGYITTADILLEMRAPCFHPNPMICDFSRTVRKTLRLSSMTTLVWAKYYSTIR